MAKEKIIVERVLFANIDTKNTNGKFTAGKNPECALDMMPLSWLEALKSHIETKIKKLNKKTAKKK